MEYNRVKPENGFGAGLVLLPFKLYLVFLEPRNSFNFCWYYTLVSIYLFFSRIRNEHIACSFLHYAIEFLFLPVEYVLFSAQIKALRDANLARILCDNGDSIQLMQPLAFKKVSEM